MKQIILILLLLISCPLADAVAKVKDPIVMTVGNIKVPRSEFEAFYNKNSQITTDSTITFDNYVDMYITYKLKVAEAMSRGIDTTQTFRDEFENYRRQLVESFRDENYWKDSLINELVTRLPYELRASHILLNVPANASDSLDQATLAKIEDYRHNIEAGAPFDSLAREVSDCPSKERGGDLGYFRLLQMVYPFEDAAYSTKVDSLTICRSKFGYHLIKVTGKKKISMQNLNPIIKEVIDGGEPGEELLGQLRMAVEHDPDRIAKGKKMLEERWPESEIVANPEYQALYKEYYDGIMLFNVANEEVWAKAESDTTGLKAYFEENRAKYKYDQPRFKGAFIECADDENLKRAMCDIYENNDMRKAAELVRATILKDSILTPNPHRPRFHIVNGVFKAGDNAAVDAKLGIDREITLRADFPVQMVYGHVLNEPETLEDVRETVVSDYLNVLEEAFVEKLKAKYKVKVNKKELGKINK